MTCLLLLEVAVTGTGSGAALFSSSLLSGVIDLAAPPSYSSNSCVDVMDVTMLHHVACRFNVDAQCCLLDLYLCHLMPIDSLDALRTM